MRFDSLMPRRGHSGNMIGVEVAAADCPPDPLPQPATSPAIMLSGVCLAVLPVLVVFLAGQRYIVEGITMTGLKG